jgi:GH25 family lysozyme M1 (1,4-beta-N-acetylmuramidase)
VASEGQWYQDENGIVLTGLQTIESRDYLFDSNGILQGFKKVNGVLYYYNPDGTQAKGVQRIAGKYYKFNEITGAFEKMVQQKVVIDISSHNGVVDWNAVKNSGKVDAVILRLGYGIGYMDTTFLTNVKELNRLGIPYSVYLFSYAENGSEATKEGQFVVNTIKNNSVNISSNLFSIYYDLEDWTISSTGESSYGISQESYRNIILSFKNVVESNLAIKARVYASKNYILTRFPTDVQSYATWVAEWNSSISYTGPYEGWQYTSKGSVPGITGNVDMSIFYY